MDVVVIPIYNRDDCLTITLTYLEKTPQAPSFYYLFVADTGYLKTLKFIVKSWLSHYPGELYEVDPSQAKSPIKQSYAIYMGYKRAISLNPQVIFLIEDDVAISNRFFEWHYKILEKPEVDLSIATKQRDIRYPIPEDFEGYIIRHDYQSLGVAWPVKILKRVLTVFTPQYWTNPFKYMREIYPQVKENFVASQDGLIRKTILGESLNVAFPVYPRAFHFGYYGSNRGAGYNVGSLASKIARIKTIAFDENGLKEELLKQGRPLDPYFYDSIPVSLEQQPITRLVQR